MAFTGEPARRSAPAGALRRLILPLLCALGLVAAIEGSVQLIWHPTFWQKTTWLMHDPYHGGEIFDRLELYIRLSHLENSEPDIISVGDSSGFFSLQSAVVNRSIAPSKFLSLNTGANQDIAGYAGIAAYMLRRSPHIRYVVLYMFPQLLPEPIPMGVADLGPITWNDLASVRADLTPPSALGSPYAKAWVFDGRLFHPREMVGNHVPSLQLLSTVDAALGWLPEFDVRYDRVDGRAPFYPDHEDHWYDAFGLTDPSSINVQLDGFDRMVRSHGARLVIAFAPIAQRLIFPGDPNIAVADQALARFQREHPDVTFLFPLITPWSPEKMGMFNHVSREYTFLSSERLGRALARLLHDPAAIPRYTAQYKPLPPLDPVTVTPLGPSDPALLAPALALYLYSSTADPHDGALLSRRVQALLQAEPAFQSAMQDERRRLASQEQQHIKIGFDLSQMKAVRVAVTGHPACAGAPGGTPQWVHLYGTMIFTYDSPGTHAREPVIWPESSYVLVPTVVEDGVRKFDGYCPEPSMAATP